MEAIVYLLMKKRLNIQTFFYYFNNFLYKRIYSFAERPQLLSLVKARFLLVLASLLCFRIRLVHVEQHTPYHHCYSFER